VATRALCWLRRDLRVSDHAALEAATAAADEVAVAFVFDRHILDGLPDRDDRRVTFIHGSLLEVDQRLRDLGSRLVVRNGVPEDEIPRLAAEFGASAVYAGRDFEPYALDRDRLVAERLQADGRRLELLKDSVLIAPDELLNGSGQPYRVFTPYHRAWETHIDDAFVRERIPDLRRLAPETNLPAHHGWDLPDLGFEGGGPMPAPGETRGAERLSDFLGRIDGYGTSRNRFEEDATSRLSVDLRFGTVSVRAAARAALARTGEDSRKWLAELGWRDFFQMILFHFPHVAKHAFSDRYRGVVWPGDPSHLAVWEEGRTGFPVVDAAMRCLTVTGWMPNRLRMVVASFLTKDLLLDYRLGEAVFARRLLDFDLASNNGNWQWAASTGVDSQPYHRVFHPVLQSEKYDPPGGFIRKWCPELAELDSRHIHWPAGAPPFELMQAGVRLGETYPHPIVDHAERRKAAISLLSSR
jgi:deoxyribodipyrimidine photo-lyase